MEKEDIIVFEDHFPFMVASLGAQGFIDELMNGFRLLMDQEKGVITFNSLKTNINSLLQGTEREIQKGNLLNDDDIVREMLREGDLDGDGCLNKMEFCVLMFRLSPALMQGSWSCLYEALNYLLHPACSH